MISPTFLRLQNEGFLMQGCFKSSLTALRKSSGQERAPLYVALFNFSIGLERLLKLLLILDHGVRDAGAILAMKQFGHKLGELFRQSQVLLQQYNIPTPPNCVLDDIDQQLVSILEDFAVSGRCFNLDALSGGAKSDDPLARWQKLILSIYERDVPPSKRNTSEQEARAIAAQLKGIMFCSTSSTTLDGREQTHEEVFTDHERIALVLPEVVWRLVKLLVPLRRLLMHLGMTTSTMEAPNMEEFLEFVCPDRSAMNVEDWPYWS
jgi:hypothetical protein